MLGHGAQGVPPPAPESGARHSLMPEIEELRLCVVADEQTPLDVVEVDLWKKEEEWGGNRRGKGREGERRRGEGKREGKEREEEREEGRRGGGKGRRGEKREEKGRGEGREEKRRGKRLDFSRKGPTTIT